MGLFRPCTVCDCEDFQNEDTLDPTCETCGDVVDEHEE